MKKRSTKTPIVVVDPNAINRSKAYIDGLNRRQERRVKALAETARRKPIMDEDDAYLLRLLEIYNKGRTVKRPNVIMDDEDAALLRMSSRI